MLESINNVLDSLNGYLYTYILLVLLIGGSIYFTIKTRGVQFRLFGAAIKEMGEKTDDDSSISPLQSFMISTASKLGTGNIVGVAVSIAAGGPGSVFWMILIALISGATSFVENTIGQIYKQKDPEGDSYVGGPAYYIRKCLGEKWNWLGVVYAILFIATFSFAFNPLAAFNIGSSFEHYFDGFYTSYIPYVIGGILAVLSGIVIFGGGKRIANAATGIVPIMSVIYIALTLITIVLNFQKIPAVIGMIFKDAFSTQSIFGGVAGSCVIVGLKRGLYTNEAGMGSSPYAAAAAETTHPAKTGLVQLLSIFLDTVVLCSATAFLLLFSKVEVNKDLTGMPYVQAALGSMFGEVGVIFITVLMFLFGFATLIGNYYYSESNIKMLGGGKNAINIFRVVQVFVIFIGPALNFAFAWNLGDLFMGLLTIVNMVIILLIGNVAFDALKDYEVQKKRGENPVFKESNIGISNTDCWK